MPVAELSGQRAWQRQRTGRLPKARQSGGPCGNYGFNADSDKTHGNSIYHTFFAITCEVSGLPSTTRIRGREDR
jgi:hypothetical protein